MKYFSLKISFFALFFVGFTQNLQAIIPDLTDYGSQSGR